MISNDRSARLARDEALRVLPSLLSVIRWQVMASFEAGDPEGDELKRLLEACVVGAHRLNLREQIRSNDRWGD